MCIRDRAGGDAYGIGFFLSTDARGRTFAAHDGAVAGYRAASMVELGSRTGVVLLRNYDNGRTDIVSAANRLLTTLLDGASR